MRQVSPRERLHLSSMEGEPPINLTPLIDVLFCLLIIFILITPFLALDQIDLARACATDQVQETAYSARGNLLQIVVKEDGEIEINGSGADAHELLPLFRRVRCDLPQPLPRLFVDRKAPFGRYQVVKNALEAAGFDQLEVVLEQG